jgi:hypothetical protein
MLIDQISHWQLQVQVTQLYQMLQNPTTSVTKRKCIINFKSNFRKLKRFQRPLRLPISNSSSRQLRMLRIIQWDLTCKEGQWSNNNQFSNQQQQQQQPAGQDSAYQQLPVNNNRRRDLKRGKCIITLLFMNNIINFKQKK